MNTTPAASKARRTTAARSEAETGRCKIEIPVPQGRTGFFKKKKLVTRVGIGAIYGAFQMSSIARDREFLKSAPGILNASSGNNGRRDGEIIDPNRER